VNQLNAHRILIVEDEEHLADGIRENLQAKGYEISIAYDGQEAFKIATKESFDLILMDVMIPKMDGLQTCEELRKNGTQTPVLFLTVKGDPEDRIRGLEAGGDDYLAKPFHLKELLLRVAAILRRANWYNQTKVILNFGGNEVDFQTYHARSWDDAVHLLTHKEAMILKVLAEQVGKIVPREDILDKVWGYEVFPSTRTIDNFIVRLRKRFEKNVEVPEHFHTVRGVGYRFTEQPEIPQND
tara:strand:- start:11821 stop:12543 length:723 start_codon:yes stop_codon:yes gene_type:complete